MRQVFTNAIVLKGFLCTEGPAVGKQRIKLQSTVKCDLKEIML